MPQKRSQSRIAREARPLLAVDGDSFAHRAYHALPKTILRRGRRQAGAIVGFANFLLLMYRNEAPRAVLVGWDTLDAPTYRHKAFPGYQSGRHFDEALIEQLDLLPSFVTACGFANAKAPGFEADDFLAAAVAKEEKRGGTVVVASGDRDTFQLASASTTVIQPLRLYRRIATMDGSAPLPPLRNQTPTWNAAATLAREWELGKLAQRLEQLVQERSPG
jgi:DNA polymerase-1